MIMRYHWGLAVGHTYSRNPRTSSVAATSSTGPTANPPTDDTESAIPHSGPADQDNDPDADCPEFGFANREDDLIDADEESELGDEQWVDDDDDDAVDAIDEMYGCIGFDGDAESYN